MALRWFRDKLKYLTWVLWVVILLFIIGLFFDFGAVRMGGDPRTDTAASVGGEKVTVEEFQQIYRNLESYYRQIFGAQFNQDMVQRLNLPQQALDQAIDRKVMLREARRLGLTATDTEVRNAILDFAKDSDGRFDPDLYERVLRSQRRTAKDFEESVREDLLYGKMQRLVSQVLYVSEQEVEDAYRETTELAKVRYLRLPVTEISDEIEVTEEQLAAHYDDHRADYEEPEKRRASYLLLDTASLRDQISIAEVELQAYYDGNSEEFTRREAVDVSQIFLRETGERTAEQAEAELAELRQQIEGGADFAELARQHSEDQRSKPLGGRLGMSERGSLPEAVEEAVFAASMGDIVGPVRGDFGVHLLQVRARREGGTEPFEQAKARINAKLINQRVQTLAESRAREVTQKIREEGLTDEEQVRILAEAEGLTFDSTDPFGRSEPVTGIGLTAFNSAVFDIQLPGMVADPVRIARGWVIPRLEEIMPPRVPELAEVREQVREAVVGDQKLDLAVQRLAAGRDSLGEDKTFDQLAEDLGLQVQESGEFGRRGSITGIVDPKEVVAQALQLETGDFGGPVAVDGGAVLFEVVDRKVFDPEAFAEARSATRGGELQELTGQLVGAFLEHRKRDLEPRVNPQLLQSLGLEDGALDG